MISTKPNPSVIDDLKHRYAGLQADQPKLRIRNAAEQLGVSEAELLAISCGDFVTRLEVNDWEAFMQAWKPLGKVMVLTRNDYCVHEKTGEYEQIHPLVHGGKIGLITGKIIDLRFFISDWKHAFAVEEDGPRGMNRSLQIFDSTGAAIHKIYIKSEEGVAPFHALIENYKSEDQSAGMTVEAPQPSRPDRPDEDIDQESLLKHWEELKDTHDFFPMIMQHRVGRLQELRLAEG
ncbi:MAG: ChuX/HutX family heme-like substrate-binding protein, partial [Verrucomicrobiota bacterium]